ncbi:deoxyribonuclease IV [Candidatus Nitrosotenuis cloacae]|uniref:Probable endonuclease 4 n=1 Tax=Candidatus Nitrosotenuis cloacae TaxID=1603555 RepID=A0A3G1B3D7_9ARCH|nr:deoxyribonuclease IV [Candidatus Nitrosotenuis cloacae]AJZ76092.1 endonuclease [Candidatus Nitrosotenuis cloacae]
MRVGLHVSISGSLSAAVDNAIERECSAFQIFTRSPRMWTAKEIPKQDALKFRDKLASSKIDRFATVAHMPYLPNLASPNAATHAKSVAVLIKEVQRCGEIGIPYLVAHLGSHLGEGEEKGIAQLVKAFEKAAEVKNDVTILLENTAGQKNSVGSEFAQWAEILSRLKPKNRFGVCFDTCHAFAYGYDLRSEKDVAETFKEFDETVGFEHLKILHLNDSKGELGSNLDRHEHIGLGKIGERGMASVVKMANKKDIPIILETPIDNTRDDFANLRKVKEIA